jgi:pentatricopeptide repeat protein
MAGRASEARKLFDEARGRGHAVDGCTYNVLVDALSKLADWTKLRRSFGEMKREDPKP